LLPASFGGIQRGDGSLNQSAPELRNGVEVNLLTVSDVADVNEKRPRYRFTVELAAGEENERPLVGDLSANDSQFARFALVLPPDGDTLRQLVSRVPKRERREYGTKRQTLECHVNLVETYAIKIADGLLLSNVVREALILAAKWHDHGKDREVWKRAAGWKPGEEAPGKSGGAMGRIRGGYRHEFGSLREFSEEQESKLSPEVFDLTMHLIASHHGRGRPHFPKGGFDPDAQAANHFDFRERGVHRFAQADDAVGGESAGEFALLVHSDRAALHGEVPGTGKAGGTGTDDGTSPPREGSPPLPPRRGGEYIELRRWGFCYCLSKRCCSSLKITKISGGAQ